MTNRVAHALASIGAQPAQPMAVLSENSVEYALLLLGAAKAGVAVAHLNWRSTGSVLADCLEVLDPRILFVQDKYQEVLADALGGRPSGMHHLVVLASQTPGAEARIRDATQTWGDFLAGGNDQPVNTDVDPETCLHIVFTSGSTGPPKGQCHVD
jgi:4-hydroxybenzoate-CoA ligase